MAKFLRVLVLSAVAFATPLAAQELPPNTTYALVTMTDQDWIDATTAPSADHVTVKLFVRFNGSLSGSFQGYLTHAPGATKSQIQTAVRNQVNAWLAINEPGNSLNNAHILLGGLND